MNVDWQELAGKAQEARRNAYEPYSHYPVGAALLDNTGTLWTGCNVENVSFGMTICAERTAIVKMVSAGVRKWKAIAVLTRDGGTPCGACLQVLAEFASPDAAVAAIAEDGTIATYSFEELLPHAFKTNL